MLKEVFFFFCLFILTEDIGLSTIYKWNSSYWDYTESRLKLLDSEKSMYVYFIYFSILGLKLSVRRGRMQPVEALIRHRIWFLGVFKWWHWLSRISSKNAKLTAMWWSFHARVAGHSSAQVQAWKECSSMLPCVRTFIAFFQSLRWGCDLPPKAWPVTWN